MTPRYLTVWPVVIDEAAHCASERAARRRKKKRGVIAFMVNALTLDEALLHRGIGADVRAYLSNIFIPQPQVSTVVCLGCRAPWSPPERYPAAMLLVDLVVAPQLAAA